MPDQISYFRLIHDFSARDNSGRTQLRRRDFPRAVAGAGG
jgi:hypothetical protein